MLDKSCLQLAVRRKDKTETLTFQVGDWTMGGEGVKYIDVGAWVLG